MSITDLARELAVSQMTIRRDLHSLEATGDVRLVHGGASLTPHALHSAAFGDDDQAGPRDCVGRHAAGLVGPTDTIAIDAGPTAYAIARALPKEFSGCVITHSMPVLQYLVERPSVRVVALGGELLADRHAFVGPTTEAAVTQLRVRTFFLSPAAVDARGTYSGSPAEASVQRGADRHRGPGHPRVDAGGLLELGPGAGGTPESPARLGGRPVAACGRLRRPGPRGRRCAHR